MDFDSLGPRHLYGFPIMAKKRTAPKTKFPCPHCGKKKATTNPEALKGKGAAPFACEACGKAITLNDLKPVFDAFDEKLKRMAGK